MNILDTRDLQKKLSELEDEKTTLEEAVEEAQEDADTPDSEKEAVEWELADWLEENEEELAELNTLANEVPEWIYGEALIPEDYFEEYCQELLQDIGVLPRELPAYIAIDWGATANNIRQDYSPVEYQGDTYLFRK